MLSTINRHIKLIKKFLLINSVLILFYNTVLYGSDLKNCEWNNKDGTPCITIKKTPNTSAYSSKGVNKQIITRQDIIDMGAVDITDVLEMIPGIDLKQNGQKGQLASLFTRGTNSNHTLVLLNGIAINDQSTTQGLHNFGQDFVQTIQQVEIYKGANGAHFGPSAIGGAINFITAIDYQNNLTVGGFSGKNNSIDGNYSTVTDNGWHLNLKASLTNSETGSAKYGGKENDDVKNKQLNFNVAKWINDNLKFRSTVYSRQTKADYDGSATDENGYFADDKMHVIQMGLDSIKNNTEDSLTFHYNSYDREYEDGGYFDSYYSESVVVKGERKIKSSEKISIGFGTEYKYDWGHFTDNGSWSNPSAKGNIYDLGVFGNAGYKLSEDTIFSMFARTDNHKTTNQNSTYKINLTKLINNFKLGLTHSTGLRNPSLYELYGHNGRIDGFKHVANLNAKPEKSQTNEFFAQYNFSDDFFFKTTTYRTSIKDALLYNNNFHGGTGYTNTKEDLKQEGIEMDFVLKRNNERLSIFNTVSTSKQQDGTQQLNRPDSTYGLNYLKKFRSNLFGTFNLNIKYKHYGKVFDYAPTITKVDSTDIMNLSLTKKISSNLWSINLSNLLDENYQRPHGYSQEGRRVRLNFKKSY